MATWTTCPAGMPAPENLSHAAFPSASVSLRMSAGVRPSTRHAALSAAQRRSSGCR